MGINHKKFGLNGKKDRDFLLFKPMKIQQKGNQYFWHLSLFEREENAEILSSLLGAQHRLVLVS